MIAVSKERLFSLDVGIFNPMVSPPRDQFFPKDRIKFLELLPGRFRGAYFHASLIEDVK